MKSRKRVLALSLAYLLSLLLSDTAGAGGLRSGDRTPAVGTRVLVHGKFRGVLRFTGRTAFGDPRIKQWCGIELDKPSGKNDGSVKGVRYFAAAPKHGLFTLPANVVPLTADEASADASAAAGNMASATTVMRAVSAAATAEGDPAPTAPLNKEVTRVPGKPDPTIKPAPEIVARAVQMSSRPALATTDPRDVPFRVSSAKEYLSALDSRIQNMERHHAEASALAHAQESLMEKTSSARLAPIPASRLAPLPTISPGDKLDFLDDPASLAKDNDELDEKIKNLRGRISRLKGQ
jgi:hypothetical protein